MSKVLSKTQKKLDNKIREVLTNICEDSLKDIPGFAWITHQADYANFPASLFISCIFEREEEKNAADVNQLATVKKMIHARLLKIGVVIKKVDQQVVTDSEEACEAEHDGNWKRRLEAREGRAIPKSFPNVK